jgi:hypothetical protein
LRSAAKVAVSAALGSAAACGGLALDPGPTPALPGEPTAPPREPVPPPREPHATLRPDAAAALLCDAQGAQLDASVPAETAACCRDLVASRVPDGGEMFAAEEAADPSVRACCTALVAGVSHREIPWEAVGPSSLWACCEALGNPFSVACTPWGPPVPPSVPDEDALWGLS